MKLFIIISTILVTVNCYTYDCKTKFNYVYPDNSDTSIPYDNLFTNLLDTMFNNTSKKSYQIYRSHSSPIFPTNPDKPFISATLYLSMVDKYKPDNITSDRSILISKINSKNPGIGIFNNIYCVIMDNNGCPKGLINYDFIVNYSYKPRNIAEMSNVWFESGKPTGASDISRISDMTTTTKSQKTTISNQITKTTMTESNTIITTQPTEITITPKFRKKADIFCKDKNLSTVFGYRSYNIMVVGDVLHEEEYLVSTTGNRLILQKDGNLCAIGYDGFKYWCKSFLPTDILGPYYMKLGSVGDICFYGKNNIKYDCLNTFNRTTGSYIFGITNGGDIALFNNGHDIISDTLTRPYVAEEIVPLPFKL